MKARLYFSLLSSVMFCNLAYGACTPSPDCASLGYTASSCPNGGVKCPFDTSKWHCDNCRNTFKYTCKGSNEIGGVGTSCDEKYESCNCASGYKWKNGKCVMTVHCCDDISECGAIGNGYRYCKQYNGLDDCSQVIASCTTLGGMAHLIGCVFIGRNYYTYYGAQYECLF